MISSTKRRAIQRGGFVSTFLVLAVMVSLAVIGMLCAKTLVAQRRFVERTSVEAQLELMIVAAQQWQQAGGEIAQEDSVTLMLSENDAEPRCELQLVREDNIVTATAIVKRNGKLMGTRKFEFSSRKLDSLREDTGQ